MYFGLHRERKSRRVFEIINRSGVALSLSAIHTAQLSFDSATETGLKKNSSLTFKTEKQLNSTLSYSDPYWLKEPHSQGLFTVKDPLMIGRPENSPAVIFDFTFKQLGEQFVISSPLIYKWTDPVKGELMRPFEIVPPVFVNLNKPVYLFTDQSQKEVTVTIKSSKDNCIGTLQLKLPSDWKSEPANFSFEIKKRGEEQTFTFYVLPSKEESTNSIGAFATIDNNGM